MRSHKYCSLSFAALCVVAALALSTLSGRGQQDKARPSSGREAAARAEREKGDPAPVAIYDAPEPGEAGERTRRRAKGEKYDGMENVWELPDDLVVSPRSNHWVAGIPAIPSAQSDLVVLGEVVEAQAFLSNDKKGIYSEFGVRVGEVLKNDSRRPVNVGETMTAERAGGSVRFPSGRVQRIHVYADQRMPQVGHRYVLFLRGGAEATDPTIVTGYELREGRVVSLDSTKPFSDYDGSDEFTFLGLVRDAINSPAPPQAHGKEGVNR